MITVENADHRFQNQACMELATKAVLNFFEFQRDKISVYKSNGGSFSISAREKDAILTHMFPLGPLPRNREAWIITMADKVCAILEVCHIAVALARRNRVIVSY